MLQGVMIRRIMSIGGVVTKGEGGGRGGSANGGRLEEVERA